MSRIYEALSAHQSVCLRKISKNRSGERMMGRFFDNDHVSIDHIKDDITKQVKEVVSDRHVLCIQDTTEINHSAHSGRVVGLGPIGNPKNIGFFLHPSIVIDATDGALLGISSIHTHIRPLENTTHYQASTIEQKESFRWIESAINSKSVLSRASTITVIADRESDIYEEWASIPNEKTHLLTRSCHDRRLQNGENLFQFVSSLPIVSSYEIDIDQRNHKRKDNKALIDIRFSTVFILKPRQCTDFNTPAHIQLYVVDVCESPSSVPANGKAIHWCLLTTHKIDSDDKAREIVKWYQSRWNIEQVFRTLKHQGMDVETSQLETAEKLIKLTIMALQVAVQTMQLTLARSGKDQAIGVVFKEKECQVLADLQNTCEGKTQKQKNPYDPKRLSWAAWTIARLGGWKGYASESPPGPITIRNGLEKFKQILVGYQIGKNKGENVCID